MRPRWILALSLANLCYFRAWRELLSPQGLSYWYYWKEYPGYPLLGALVLNVLVLAGIFRLGFYLSKRWEFGRKLQIAPIIFLLIFFRALNNIRTEFDSLSTTHLRALFGKAGYAAGVVLFLLLIALAIKRFGLIRVARAAALIVFIWSPFGLLGLVQATWLAAKYGRSISNEKTSAQPISQKTKTKPRVVWIIFDEMGQRLPFDERPSDLSLPEFDRLRAQSVFATQAFPPAGHTSQSIPALLTGQLIAAVRPAGPGELMFTLPNQTASIKLSETPTVFADANKLGFNSELVGWYHPYCRVIGNQLTRCYWHPATQRLQMPLLSFRKDLIRQNVGVLKLLPFTTSLQEKFLETQKRDYRSEHLEDYKELMRRAVIAVTNRDSDLLFIHLPVPHPPYVFDRRRSATSISHDNGILDNLALADKALGELRQQMELSGVWQTSTVIVSSDHWWRSDYWQAQRLFWNSSDVALKAATLDHRVPFLMKLAGQNSTVQYDTAWNTVLTHDLILAVLKGEISGAPQVTAWIDGHRTIGESPYQSYEDE